MSRPVLDVCGGLGTGPDMPGPYGRSVRKSNGVNLQRPSAVAKQLPTRPSGRAFTLVEILVVVTIVAILAGVVVVNFVDSAGQRRVQAEAERLALAVELARGESVRRNEVWGLAIENQEYGFVRRDVQRGRWQEVEEPEFRWHGVEVDLRIEGRAGRPAPSGPEIAIFPNGETTPFTVLVSQGTADQTPAWHVTTDGIGRTLARPAAEARTTAGQ